MNAHAEPIVRNRTVYGTTCRDVINALYGLGIEPKRVEMLRIDGQAGNRVRFDVILDGEIDIFQNKTIEELLNAIDGIEVAKKLFEKGDVDITKLFDKPQASKVHDRIAISFGDVALADATVPVEPGNSNVRDYSSTRQVAASHTEAPVREKNPKRQAAGLKASAKRWNRVAGVPGVPQTTASPISVPSRRRGSRVVPAPAPAPARKKL